jgi:exodeoxyribonuclease-3
MLHPALCEGYLWWCRIPKVLFIEKDGFTEILAHAGIPEKYDLAYCFASDSLLEKVNNVVIGEFEFWKAHSDHLPLTIDFDF